MSSIRMIAGDPRSRRNVIFIAIFLAMMFAPMIQTLMPIVRVRPLEENRNPAPLPPFYDKLLHGDGRLAREVNHWFDDRMGFRSLLVRMYNQVQYSVFHHSDRVYIGRDGMLFMRSYVDETASFERGGEDWQQAIRAKFMAIQQYLANRGIRLVIVSMPIKASLYRHLLPQDAPKIPAVSQFGRLREFLAGNRDWIYVDGQSAAAQCGSYDAFYKTDIHMTTPAVYCTAKEIVGKISSAEGHAAAAWNPVFTYHQRSGYSGGLAKFLATLAEPKETIDVADFSFTDRDRVPDGSFEERPKAPFETIYRANRDSGGAKLPPIVLYGNSFVDPYSASGMYFAFESVHRIRSNGIPIQDMLRNLPNGTRYVVVQFLESYLGEFLTYEVPAD